MAFIHLVPAPAALRCMLMRFVFSIPSARQMAFIRLTRTFRGISFGSGTRTWTVCPCLSSSRARSFTSCLV